MLQKYWASTVIFIGIFSQCRNKMQGKQVSTIIELGCSPDRIEQRAIVKKMLI